MCNSSSKKIETPAETQIQAERGVNRWNERIHDGYTELESAAIEDSKVNRTGLLAGRGGADLAGIEQQAVAAAVAGPNGPTAADLRRVGTAINASSSDVRNTAARSALQMQDAQKLNTVHTGSDIAVNTDRSLSALSRNAMETAFTDAQNEVLRSNARFNAAMSAIEGAAVGGMMRYRKGLNTPPAGGS